MPRPVRRRTRRLANRDVANGEPLERPASSGSPRSWSRGLRILRRGTSARTVCWHMDRGLNRLRSPDEWRAHREGRAGQYRGERGAPAQPPGGEPRASEEPPHRFHWSEWVRQVIHGFRHPLRRGAEALRGVAVELRPAVPGANGEAPVRPYPRSEPHHRHRTESGILEPAIHRGDHHRDPRLPARALRAHWRPTLPAVRPSGGGPAR